MLSEVTGRPKCVRASDVTAPLEAVLQEDMDYLKRRMHLDSHVDHIGSHALWLEFLGSRRNVAHSFTGGSTAWGRFGLVGNRSGGKHFTAALQLSALSDAIGTRIYLSPADLTWADVQKTVHELATQLAYWKTVRQPDLALENLGHANIDPRSHIELALYYHSIRLMLYRPFLCEIDIGGESSQSAGRNKLYARSCVQAAVELVKIMPDDPVAEQVLQILPWWVLTHYICQAAGILLLEMVLGNQHLQGDAQEVIVALKKALNYLWVLCPTSKSAYRAWTMTRLLAERVNQRYRQNDLHDLFLEAPRPREWSSDDAESLLAIVTAISKAP